eukprot:7390397-Prymnesium_polylepis.1
MASCTVPHTACTPSPIWQLSMETWLDICRGYLSFVKRKNAKQYAAATRTEAVGLARSFELLDSRGPLSCWTREVL